MSSCTARSPSRAATPTSSTTTSSSANSISACNAVPLFLQLPYRSPVADIVLAAARAVDDRSVEREMRVPDLVGAAGGDLLQPLGIEVGARHLALPVECIEEADMWRDELPRAGDVAQPFAKFTQFGAVLDLDKDSAERRNDRAHDGRLGDFYWQQAAF